MGESRVGHGTFRSQNIVDQKATLRPKKEINAFATCIQHQQLLLSTQSPKSQGLSRMLSIAVLAESVDANQLDEKNDQCNAIIVVCT